MSLALKRRLQSLEEGKTDVEDDALLPCSSRGRMFTRDGVWKPGSLRVLGYAVGTSVVYQPFLVEDSAALIRAMN